MTAIPVFEEHGEVLALWVERGWERERVVVFDHHLDFKRIAPAALLRLREAHDPVALNALCRDLPTRDDDRYAFGLDDFLYAAAFLGVVREIVWVYPERRPLTDRQLARLLLSTLAMLPGHGRRSRRRFTPTRVGLALPCWAYQSA